MAEKDMLSIREAARLLQRSTKSLRNYVKAGKLAAEKVAGPKGPQFMFKRSDLEALSADLQVDHAPSDDAPHAAETQALTTGAPPSLGKLVEAYLAADRDRTRLMADLADTRAKAQHTIGVLEERVEQLQSRLKREQRDAQRVSLLERENEKLRKKMVQRETLLRDLNTLRKRAERRHWWQLWRTRFEQSELPDTDG